MNILRTLKEFLDPFAAQRRHVAELRDKYVSGKATEQEIDEFWEEVLKDPEQLELLKTEVNLRAVIQEQSKARSSNESSKN